MLSRLLLVALLAASPVAVMPSASACVAVQPLGSAEGCVAVAAFGTAEGDVAVVVAGCASKGNEEAVAITLYGCNGRLGGMQAE